MCHRQCLTGPQDTLEKPFSCHNCGKGFSRRDVQEKHSKQCGSSNASTTLEQHKDNSRPSRWPRSTRACDRCKSRKLKCDNHHPCTTCHEKQLVCTVTPAHRGRAVRSSVQTDRDIAPTPVGGLPTVTDAAITTNQIQTTYPTELNPARRIDTAVAPPGSTGPSAASENLPAGPPVPLEHIQALEIPGSVNQVVSGPFLQNSEHISGIPPADDRIWSAYDGETDLMALFPDLPSLVSGDKL